MCKSVLKSIQSSCAQPSPCPKGNNLTHIICERFWSLNLARMSRQHMKPPSQRSNAKLIKNLHAWSMRILYVILAHMVVGTTLH